MGIPRLIKLCGGGIKIISQSYYHIAHKIREKYPDAVFYAVSRWKFQYMKAEEWNNNFIWLRELAPSEELRKAYKSNSISWEEYKVRFLAEMDNHISKELMLKIVRESDSKPVFLFCHCGPKEGNRCHRFLLLDLITSRKVQTTYPLQNNSIQSL
jgi:uncharacterized protein YeaO (DUF488 family)